MAIGLQNYDNIDLSDLGAYPYGRIKDDPGDNTGTDVDSKSYNDIHQFFAFLLAVTSIVPNGLPEDSGNLQYLAAMNKFVRAQIATETQLGTAEIATQAEVDAGSDNERIITALKLQAAKTVMGVDGTVKLRARVVDIGDWNMDTTDTINVALPGAIAVNKIRQLTVMIRNDDDNVYRPLDRYNLATGNMDGGVRDVTTTQIALGRTTGGDFDGAGFNATTYNRGYITIIYEA